MIKYLYSNYLLLSWIRTTYVLADIKLYSEKKNQNIGNFRICVREK